MKVLRLVACLMTIGALAGMSAVAAVGAPKPYRAIVVFDDQLGDSVRESLIEKAKGIKLKKLDIIDGAAVLLPSEAAAAALAETPGVKRVDEDILVEASGKGSGKPGGQSGGEPAPAQVVPWGVDRIDADLTWAAQTGAGVKVAVIDTGIQLKHPDLAANVKGGYNAINPAKSANDDNGHGTHVAGTIAAVSNDYGVIGAAPDVDLYAVKVLSAAGSGWLSDVIEGIDWSVANGMQVINMSLGSGQSNASEREAILRAYTAGVTIVAAAGNNYGGAVDYPAAYDEVIAVSATTGSDGFAGFSSMGPQVDLAAPGASVYSTYKGSAYKTLNGTSMAAPHVAGSAALVIGANGPLSPAQVKAKLQATADYLSGLTTFQQGAGLVDAEEAVLTP